ncbi:MAG TPA: pseudouridine synthase, partial [Candidatus Eisenbacteria bacterium]|nr:pseudouridine synthase [Candidatus Eisenbacteria bacterium]
EDLSALRRGIRLEDGWTAPARVRLVKKLKKKAWVEIEIHEGRKREVRRMFGALGYFVEKLLRDRIGPVSLGSLPPAGIRPLSPEEIGALNKAVGLDGETRKGRRSGARM